MPIELDIRNKRTERAICQAMLDLMKEKPFARLSVTDVATAAGISRSTFYAHYTNLEEVFSALVREFHDTVADREWVTVTAEIKIVNHPLYGRRGPVLTVTSLKKSDAPENEVATFF